MENKKIDSMELTDLLRRAIITGEYKPRQRLVEKDLAEKYAVSRTPVREAIKHLEALGLVTLERYKGAVVADIDPHVILEMQVVRANLEGLASNLAAPLLTQEQLDLLADYEQTMEAAAASGDIQQFSAYNEMFHMLIFQNCGNKFLYDTILQILKRSWHEPCSSWKALGDVAVVVRGHQRILTALQERDAVKAQQAAEQHVYDALAMNVERRKSELDYDPFILPFRDGSLKSMN